MVDERRIFFEKMLHTALGIAYKYHTNVDDSEFPYIFHPIRVMEQTQIHDVLKRFKKFRNRWSFHSSSHWLSYKKEKWIIWKISKGIKDFKERGRKSGKYPVKYLLVKSVTWKKTWNNWKKTWKKTINKI